MGETNNSDRPYDLISFSDFDCVKGLIKNRSIFHGEGSYHVNAGVIAIYVTLDDLISKSNLNIKQRFVIERIMEGYTEKDVSETFFKQNDSSQIQKVLNTVCKKIIQTNHHEWLYNHIYLNCKKAPFEYKRCAKCNVNKPMTLDFFNKEPLGKDGFKNKCRVCLNK